MIGLLFEIMKFLKRVFLYFSSFLLKPLLNVVGGDKNFRRERGLFALMFVLFTLWISGFKLGSEGWLNIFGVRQIKRINAKGGALLQ